MSFAKRKLLGGLFGGLGFNSLSLDNGLFNLFDGLHADHQLKVNMNVAIDVESNGVLTSGLDGLTDIETLAVRPAPIYDTGASLWSGELDVDGRDWFAKPFCTATGKPSALRQLRLVEDWSRFDLDALSDWPDEVAHELSRMRMFAPERLDAIRVQLVKRIGMLRRIREGEVLRVSGPIRNKTDLMDRFGETLRKNLGQRDGDARSVGTGPDALSRHLNR